MTPLRRRAPALAISAVLALVTALAMTACTPRTSGSGGTSGGGTASGGSPGATSTAPGDLGFVEVRDFQGKKLTAIADEPENSIKGPQHVDISTYRLKITGRVAKPLSLSYANVLAIPSARKIVELNCVEGWTVTYLWEGVRLGELLGRAGFDKNAKVVIFHCVDGYTSSLPLQYVLSRDILLAYKMNGLTMPPERGYPFQVVAEDRYGYKWAKWVQEIEVSDDANYLGYWEKRGYDNGATLPGK